MKNILKKIFPVFLLTAIVFSFNSCEEDEDKWIYNGEALASFPGATSSAFFVQDVADPVFEIEVALNTLSSAERSISLEVDTDLSTAMEGTHFTMPSSVVIAPNEVIGTFEIRGVYANLPNEALTLVINITGDNVADYDNTYTLSINKFVPFDIANFTGTFECTEHSYFGDFTYDVTLSEVDGEDAVLVSPFGAGMEAAYGLPLGGMEDLKVIFHVSNPASFTTSTEESLAFMNGDVPSYYSAATGILNTLTNSFTLGQIVIYDDEGAWDIISGIEISLKTP